MEIKIELKRSLVMKAGFGKVCITPPVGTLMYGYGNRDIEKGCESINDDLFVRAAYFSHTLARACFLTARSPTAGVVSAPALG